MKTLINIYENIKPKIAYHVADSDDRNSIKKFGLDPSKSKIAFSFIIKTS
jgi:hypothetical protein